MQLLLQAISDEDRTTAKLAINKEKTMLSLMYNNDCSIRALQMVSNVFSANAILTPMHQAIRKIRLHSQLQSVVFGRVSVLNRNPDRLPPTPPDTTRLLDIIQYTKRADRRSTQSHQHDVLVDGAQRTSCKSDCFRGA